MDGVVKKTGDFDGAIGVEHSTGDVEDRGFGGAGGVVKSSVCVGDGCSIGESEDEVFGGTTGDKC